MKRKLLAIALMFAVCFSITACGSESAEGEKITIGCEATTPGWITTDDDGNVEGFEVDVWNEISERTGYEVEFKVMDWDGMWKMLDDERLDTVAEQISETPERTEKYVLSKPYAYNRYCLLSRGDNNELNSIEDIKDGMTISCESNTSDELVVDAMEEKYGFKLERTFYDGMSVTDVAMGRCDLWPRAETSCNITVKEVDNLKILAKTDILETNVYPFTNSERGKELEAAVSKAIDEMREDGTLAELCKKWFDEDISSQPEGAETLVSYSK